MKLRYEWTLNRRLIGAAVGLVVMTSFTVEMYFLHSTRATMERGLKEKADFINKFYVNSIAESLSAQDDVRLLQDINRLEEDQEVTSVVVVDQTGSIRYHSDPEKVGAHLDDPLVEESLKSGEGAITMTKNSGGKAMVLTSPFRVRGQAAPIGAVRMDLTYRNIQRQLDVTKKNYRWFLFGLLMFWIGAARYLANRWIILPLQNLRRLISILNPTTMEPNLIESTSEFGQIYKSLNELILKVRNELQGRAGTSLDIESREKHLAESVAITLGTGYRLLVIDRDNRVISDSEPGPSRPLQKPHLLDLITDNDFSTLVASAFQKEGELLKAPVTFQDKPYDAVVLRIPAQKSLIVRTLIALKPRSA